MTGYGMSVTVGDSFEQAMSLTRQALADQGFGVLTEIDVRATLRAKLGVEVPAQVILGACNPSLAHRALTVEPDLGLLLPCNVVVRATDAGIVVSALDPQVMARVADRQELQAVADEARARLTTALGAVEAGSAGTR